MISDLDLVARAAAAYTDPASWRSDSCYACVTEIDGIAVVAFRGSVTADDWLSNLDAIPAWDVLLGWTHSGFLAGMRSVADQIIADLSGQKTAISGHSRGGSIGLLFAAKLVTLGKPPVKISTFGAARVGELRGLLKGIPGTDYRKGLDPVPELPSSYEHPRPVQDIGEASLDPLEDHHIAGYAAAIATLPVEAPPALA